MAKREMTAEEKAWKRPAHSGFDGPAYGEVVPIGEVRKYRDGTTYVITKDGPKLIKRL